MDYYIKNIKTSVLNYIFILLLIQECKTVNIDNSLIKTITIAKDNFFIEKNDTIFHKDEKYKNFNFYKVDLSQIDLSEKNKYNFIRINISFKNQDIFSPLQIYVNTTLNDFMLLNDENELFMVDYNLNEKNPTIFLPKKYYESHKFFYFFVQSEIHTEYVYTVELIENENILIKGDNRFNIFFKPGKISIYYELPENGIRSGFLVVGLLTPNILEEQSKLLVNGFCRKDGIVIGKNYPYFINGVGTLIDSGELVKCQNKIILIEINNNLNKQIYAEFTTQYISEKGMIHAIDREIYINEVFTSIILSDKNNLFHNYKQCFKFNSKNTKSSYFNLIIRSIASELYISVSNKNYIKGSLISFSKIIKFKMANNINIDICIQNKNRYNAGLQAQIIENIDDLNINNYYYFTTGPILPLINGFPTDDSIKENKKMIYKVNVNAFYSSINANKYKDKIIKYHLIVNGLSKMKMYHLKCKIFKIPKNSNIIKNDNDNNICEIIDNISYEISNNIYLNYNYKIENLLYYEEYVLVECKNMNKECKFQIEVNVQDNYDTFPTQLFTRNNNDTISNDVEYFYSWIIKSNIETYKISISNRLKKGTKIYFILYMFSGDAEMAIYDYNNDKKMERVIQDAFYSSIGKKKLLLYEIKNQNQIYFREILLKISGISSGYYSVKYYIIEEKKEEKINSLPIEEFNLEKISFNDLQKVYSLKFPKNKNISDYIEIFDEYYITINTINCIIEASFMNKKYIGREIQILYKLKNFDNKLKISLKKLDSNTIYSNNNTEFCTYYISSNPIGYKENNIIISEGIIYSMTLTKNLNLISYIYPYVYNGNTISICLYKYNLEDLKISVLINGNTKLYDSILRNINYKKIMIFIGTLEKYCKNIKTNNYYKITYLEENYVNNFNFCPIHIKIELPNELKNYDESYKNYYQLEVFSNSQTPAYLKGNQIVFNSILANQYKLYAKKPEYINYYSDIGNDFPIEINLNFKYGYGEAVAKVMSRNEVDILPTWNKKVRLPTKEDNDKNNYLEYDYERNRFVIDEKYKKKCEDGCEVYIGIFCRETSSYLQVNDFFLILYKNNNRPINLFFNREINDYISKDFNEKYYISKLENENIDSLFFTFKSKYCKLCVILIKDKNINEDNIDITEYKNKKCDWEFNNESEILNKKEYMFNINMDNEKLKGNKLNKIKILSKIYTDIKDNTNNLYYSLKINRKQKDLPLIVKVDSTNNDMTILDNETGLGYYEIHIQDYQLIREIHIFVSSDELIIQNNIVLYAKVFSMEEYNNNGFNKKVIQSIINSNNGNLNSNIKNYLHLNLEGDNNDKIILLIVKCLCIDKLPKSINHYIRIMTSFYKSSLNTSIKSYNYKLYEVGIHPINFFIPLIDNKYSIIIINSIKGKGKIMINNKYEIIIDDAKNNYKIILDKEKNENFVSVTVYNNIKSLNSEDSFIFYIYLLFENMSNYIYQISPKKNNYIFYPNIDNIKDNNYFSFYYDFSYLFEYNRKKDIFNYIIFEIQFLNESFLIKDYNLFDINCSMINKENIINNKNIIEQNSLSDIYYNENSGYLYIIFNIDNNIVIDQTYNYKYFYISIKNNIIDYNNNDKYIPIKIKEIDDNNIKEIINNCIIIKKNSNNIYDFPDNKKEKNNNTKNEDGNIKETKKVNKIVISKKYIVIIIVVIILIILYMIRCYKKYYAKKSKDYKKMDIDLPMINH